MKRTRKNTKQHSLGSMEQLRDPKHLPKVRKKQEASSNLRWYCEMLETQINALVDKLMFQTNSIVFYNKKTGTYYLGDQRHLKNGHKPFMELSELIANLHELLD